MAISSALIYDIKSGSVVLGTYFNGIVLIISSWTECKKTSLHYYKNTKEVGNIKALFYMSRDSERHSMKRWVLIMQKYREIITIVIRVNIRNFMNYIVQKDPKHL